MKRNPHFAKFSSNYLFQQIFTRKREFLEKNPKAHLISLGVGDTTLPLVGEVVEAMKEKAHALGTKEGYTGYSNIQGSLPLREALVNRFYKGLISPDEIFINDGAKPEMGRLQLIFGADTHIALQDPTYPAYQDVSVALGQTGCFREGGYEGISYLPCTEENHFFPLLKPADLIYFCSPNNPTGAVATKEQLKELVSFAKKIKAFIVFDSAYAEYIQDQNLPKSIYEIQGGAACAMEVSSFSKLAGFTGVRLGWSVVPKSLTFEGGESVWSDFARLHATFFNGASNVAEAGALAALSDSGFKGLKEGIAFYRENAKLLKDALQRLRFVCYGGENAPYLWVKMPQQTSWEAFDYFLEKYHILTTPGSGFGPSGEGFLRFSAFGTREDVLEAIKRVSERH